MGFNEDGDRFLSDLERQHDEDPLERKARHYVEDRIRFATVDSVASLARSVAEVTTAQLATANQVAELTRSIAEVAASQTKTNAVVEKIAKWMEGDITADGDRKLGFVDQMAMFRKWRGRITWTVTVAASGIVGLLAVAIARLVLELGTHSLR